MPLVLYLLRYFIIILLSTRDKKRCKVWGIVFILSYSEKARNPSVSNVEIFHPKNLWLLFFFFKLQGGESTSQEMCLKFLFYYPRMVNSPNFCNSVMYKPAHDFIGKYL